MGQTSKRVVQVLLGRTMIHTQVIGQYPLYITANTMHAYSLETWGSGMTDERSGWTGDGKTALPLPLPGGCKHSWRAARRSR